MLHAWRAHTSICTERGTSGYIIGLKTPDTRCTRRATARYKMVVGQTEENTGGLFSILEKRSTSSIFTSRFEACSEHLSTLFYPPTHGGKQVDSRRRGCLSMGLAPPAHTQRDGDQNTPREVYFKTSNAPPNQEGRCGSHELARALQGFHRIMDP